MDIAYKSLPKPKKKKKIDLKKFVTLAKKVRKSFEEEEKYLEEQSRRYEDNHSAGFLSSI